jgi:hypothetical protein
MLLFTLLALVMGLCWRVLSSEVLYTIASVVLYLLASPTAILLNKYLMKDLGFGYPVAITALGQIVTALFASCAVYCWGVSIENGRQENWLNFAALGGASALALVLGQYPYLYLTVAFIQMLKAFSPALMVALLLFLGIEYPSKRVMMCTAGLCVFTAIASAGEAHFHLGGVLLMAAASLMDALRLVLAQKLLQNAKLGPIEALYYNAPFALLWMIPASLVLEAPDVARTGALSIVATNPLVFAGASLAGCLVNIASFLLVKRVGSLTVKALTMARNGGLVLVSAMLLGEQITPLEAVGYTGLLLVFALYVHVKASERLHMESSAAGEAGGAPGEDRRRHGGMVPMPSADAVEKTRLVTEQPPPPPSPLPPIPRAGSLSSRDINLRF